MSVVRVEPHDFDWARDDGPAAQVRRIVAAADAYDGVVNLNEAATLELRHGGLEAAELFLHHDGFALLRGRELDLLVSPGARGRGIGTALLTASLAADHEILEAWSHVDHPAAGSLARGFGFDRVRDLWVMARPLEAPLDARVPDSVLVRGFTDADIPTILDINARAFAHHPEQGGLSEGDLRRRMSEAWFDPQGLLIAERAGRVAGFHWTKMHPDAVGEVYVVAVDPDAAGHGLGGVLTAAGLDYLHSQGAREVILYVDADNDPAVHLYERWDFTRSRVEAQYRRESR